MFREVVLLPIPVEICVDEVAVLPLVVVESVPSDTLEVAELLVSVVVKDAIVAVVSDNVVVIVMREGCPSVTVG